MLVELDFSLGQAQQIVVSGARDSKATGALLEEVHRHFLPNKILLLADGSDGQRYLEEKLEMLRAMKPINGKSTVYVCENFTCLAPMTNQEGLRTLLQR